jgi:endonuclease/exonuclease/phosphatase family metal-dependent hydrolase
MAKQARQFKVCTFNLFNYIEPPNAFYELENIYTDQQWRKKEAWILKLLKKISADIVGFQEVFSVSALKSLVKSAGYEYFAVVEEPTEKSEYLFDKPVVAIASKFPILSSEAVSVDQELVQSLGLEPEFVYSRQPIRAVIEVDVYTKVAVYVAHLKSKRSKFDRLFDVDTTDKEQVRQFLYDALHGRWASSIQRGTEAALLYNDFWKFSAKQDTPTIMLGDLNDTIDSTPLQLLVAGGHIDRIGSKYVSSLSAKEKLNVEKYTLYDAFEMSDKTLETPRSPTHYFANRGSVLDYVLLSKEFDANNPRSIAEVVSYDVHDDHLQNPSYEVDSEASDHAPVSVTIKTAF